MKKIFLILFFTCSLNINALDNNLTLKIYGDINIDFLAWKGGDNAICLPSFFFKDNNIFITAKHSKNLHSFLNFNFSSYKNEYILKECYINLKNKNFIIKLGKIHPFYNIELNTASNSKIFMENCSTTGFEENNLFGLMINLKFNTSNFSYYLLTPKILKQKNNDYSKTFSFFLRSFIYIESYDNLIHIGLNYKEIKRNQYDSPKYSHISITDTPFFLRPYPLSRTHYAALPNYREINYEMITLIKSLYFQSEISFIRAEWQDFNSELYKSIYITLTYILTGQKHDYDYKNGLIKNPQPNSNIGCIELAAKYSFNDITSRGSLISGICKTDSKKHTLNLGLNWYLNNNIKIQFNYAYESFIYRLLEDKKIHNLGIGIRFSF